MKVAVNLSVTELRRKQWKNISLDGLESPEALLQEDRLVKKYESPEKKVLTAAFFHEVPPTVIAEEMGTSKNTVYKIIHDARKHIKSILEENGHIHLVEDHLEKCMDCDEIYKTLIEALKKGVER